MHVAPPSAHRHYHVQLALASALYLPVPVPAYAPALAARAPDPTVAASHAPRTPPAYEEEARLFPAGPSNAVLEPLTVTQ